MNIIAFTKHKTIALLILLCTFILISLCSYQKQKDYEYPLIESDYNIEIYLPKYVPKDYEFKEIDISPLFVSVTYSSPIYGDLYYTQISSPDFSLSLDTENNNITEYNSNNYTGYLLTDTSVDSSYLLSVYNNTDSFEISGIIDKNELFKMLESISKYTP